MPDELHDSHDTRISIDASSYDEYCVKCGARDRMFSWGDLAYPCDESKMKEKNKDG